MSMKHSQSKNRLMSKVVLLIGNDPNILRPLAAGFANKGCNVALASQEMPSDIVNTIRESVLKLGRCFLFLQPLINISKGESPVAEIKREFGRIDFLVDLSGKTSDQPSSKEDRQTRLWLSKTIRQEMKK